MFQKVMYRFANGSECGVSAAEPEAAESVDCANCALDPLCRSLDYASAESGLPAGILICRRPVTRGQLLFRCHQASDSIFAVKSGSVKTTLPDARYPDQVLGFQLAGELVGAESVALGRYPTTARALETGSVCELRLTRLAESGRRQVELQQALIEVLGHELVSRHRLLATLVKQAAEQRVAGFLLDIGNRLRRRGLSGSEFKLSMSRSDIGSYLGLAGETVSRVLARLHAKGLIRLRRKRILLHRSGSLAAFCAER